jgi:hypothetical protein
MISIQQQMSMQSVTSPTRPSLQDKEYEMNSIANENAATNSLDDTNIDVENLGMTSERQRRYKARCFECWVTKMMVVMVRTGQMRTSSKAGGTYFL